jgi:ParB/RepB/Spo0J family partition protein
MIETREITTIPLERVLERPLLNCRFGRLEIAELAQSITDLGLLHPPLVVRANDRPPISEGDFYYYIVHGHRRVKAMRSLNWAEGPFFVAPPDFPLSEQYIINLAENMRENLTPAEIAERCTIIADGAQRQGRTITSEDLAKRIGFSASYLRNLMRLRRGLHPDLWEYMMRSEHHAPITKLLQVVTKPVWDQVDVWNTMGEDLPKDLLPSSPKKKSWRTIAAELVKRAPPEHARGARWLLEELASRLGRAEVERTLSSK